MPADRVHLRRLQDVEALDDEHVGLADDDALARDDVVGQVRVDRRGDLGPTGLDVGDETQQGPSVVGLGEALALQESPALELGVGEEEAVGRHELDLRRVGPAREHLAQDAGGRRLADGHGSGHADDEGRPGRALAEEVARHLVELAGRADIEVEQAREGEVDLLDLVEVDAVTEAAQAREVGVIEVERVVLAQPGPRGPVELDVGRRDDGAVGAVVAVAPAARVPAGTVGWLRHARHSCGRDGRGWRRPLARSPRLVGMCGIVGYVGRSNDGTALDVVMEGLARLEYRGYDSAGVALLDGDHVETRKKSGKLANLRRRARGRPAPRVDDRHRPHPLGHARRSDRPERPPAPRRRGRQARAHPQRHHRELPRPEAGPARRRRRRSRARPTPRSSPTCSPPPTSASTT